MLRAILLSAIVVSSSLYAAEPMPLGRLFYDAQQRAALDQQRQRNPWYGQNTSDPEMGLTFSGEVRSSSGRRTRWINGEADWNNRVPPPGVPVGNTYYPESGQQERTLGKGQIVIKPSSP